MQLRVGRSSLRLVLALGITEPDRAQGGAATGGAIGIIGGPVEVVVGAVIGSGAGALTAASTSPETINLGNPPWANRAM